MSGERVAVVGTGSWGTTLAILLAQKGVKATLWARDEEEREKLETDRENRNFLPGFPFPPSLVVTNSPSKALSRASVIMMVVPAQTMRDNVRRLADEIPPGTIIVSGAKGLENGTGLRMTQVIEQELGEGRNPVGSLSGPNLSREIARGLPAATVVAFKEAGVADKARDLPMTPRFRVYSHDDVVGVELGGALKNIIAIGAGTSDAFGCGDNAKSTLITRGLAEIARLGVACGANPLTFSGLAGIGDLFTTCISQQSRNYSVGRELAKGKTRQEIEASMSMVAEGIWTAAAALELAESKGVQMPITEQVYQVLFQDKDPHEAITDLMLREAKHELADLGTGGNPPILDRQSDGRL
jgi:glycerol-3-phosphate dehydrogenase (NAD(P)+)